MRSGFFHGSPRAPLSRALPQAASLLVLFGVAALLAVTPARAAYGGNDYASYQWTNGSVLCVFNETLPSVTMSAVDRNGTGLGAGLDQVNEVSPSTGQVVATANMSSLVWDPQNASSASAYAMSYSENVSVTSATTATTSLGSAEVTILFSLDRYPTAATEADQVSFQVSILSWPWQGAQDTLALVVPMWSAFATTEHLVVGSPTTPRIESVQTSNGQPLEYFEAGGSATTGTGESVGVSAQTTLTGGVATTTLTLGYGVGGAGQLTYEATLGITPSTRVLGLPLYDYAAVAGGAGLVALVVGVGTRRVRQRVSDLTYVEESE